MTTPMCVQQRIRQLDRQGRTHAEIARGLGVSRTTVARYADREDWSPRPSDGKAGRPSKMDAYAGVVDAWLREDQGRRPRQRHTAVRIHERLVAEYGFEGSYPCVQRWVKKWHEEHRAGQEGFAGLAWPPASAQVDFGQADAVIGGAERVVHFLVVTLPYSNMRYVVALPGEGAECVCAGLQQVFAHIGAVPTLLVFDNATGVGRRKPDGTVPVTRLFAMMTAHYGFEARFCNPRSGNGKGSVENAVGFVRRHLMVPVPSAESHRALGEAWLAQCDALADGMHYRKGRTLGELFETGLEHMLALPSTPFDPCDWRTLRAGRTGTVTVGRDRFLAGPGWHGMRLQVGVRAFQVGLRGPDGEPIRTFERPWGSGETTRIDPASLLALLARKPRSWPQSPVQERFPATLRGLLDHMAGADRRALMGDLHHVAAACGFDATMQAAGEIIAAGRLLERSGLETCARRIRQGAATGSVGLSGYDRFMKE